ncbi:MAG TPA: hypothetical protein VF132_04260 [Rudaea sp.]
MIAVGATGRGRAATGAADRACAGTSLVVARDVDPAGAAFEAAADDSASARGASETLSIVDGGRRIA